MDLPKKVMGNPARTKKMALAFEQNNQLYRVAKAVIPTGVDPCYVVPMSEEFERPNRGLFGHFPKRKRPEIMRRLIAMQIERSQPFSEDEVSQALRQELFG